MDALHARKAFQRTMYTTAGLSIAVGVGLSLWREALGGGFVLGSGAGVVAYLWLARLLPKLGTMAPNEVAVYSVRQAAARLAIYAVAFTLAYRLDTVQRLGLLGALAGFLFVRGAITVAAWRTAHRAD